MMKGLIGRETTTGMVCQSCRSTGVRTDKDYTLRMTGKGRSYKERHWERAKCPDCRKEFTRGLLAPHPKNKHGVEKGEIRERENGW